MPGQNYKVRKTIFFSLAKIITFLHNYVKAVGNKSVVN